MISKDNSMGVPRIFDRRLVALRRARAAETAEAHQFLLERVTEDLIDRLSFIERRFERALVIGAHHGLVGSRLRALPGLELVVETETSAALARRAGGPAVVAEEDALPFADAAFDLVVAPLTLHTVNDLPGALVQIRRVLRPDGLFLGALAGGETLRELRAAWIAAEAERLGGVSPRVAPFADVREMGGLLQRAGFALPVADSDVITVRYASPLALMADIKGMGMSNALAERRRVPVTRGLLMRAAEVYAERFGVADGRVPATFEIVTLTAWAPHESQPKPLRPGSAAVSLADVLGARERRPEGGRAESDEPGK